MQTREKSESGSEDRLPEQAPYNYQTFRTRNFLEDVRATREGRGVRPGEVAPAFRLADTRGGMASLDDFHGKPLLLHFGSPT